MSTPEESTEREYIVNGTITMAGWTTVYATSPEEALEEAMSMDARDFDYDPGTAEVEFNVDPTVELQP